MGTYIEIASRGPTEKKYHNFCFLKKTILYDFSNTVLLKPQFCLAYNQSTHIKLIAGI